MAERQEAHRAASAEATSRARDYNEGIDSVARPEREIKERYANLIARVGLRTMRIGGQAGLGPADQAALPPPPLTWRPLVQTPVTCAGSASTVMSSSGSASSVITSAS